MKFNKPASSINLGREKQEITHAASKWVITIGRFIIVGTELLLLTALGTRFVIDFQLGTLHDIIKSKEGILLQLQADEAKFRDYQDRLATSKQYTLDLKKTLDVVNSIRSSVESEQFSINKFSLQTKAINVDGEASNVFALDELIKKVKQIDLVDAIAIGDVKSQDSKLLFTLNVTLK